MDEKLGLNKVFIDVKKIWDEITHSKEDNEHIHEEEKMDHESQWVVRWCSTNWEWKNESTNPPSPP